MIEGVLNDRNNIYLPMYYALFFLGTSNTYYVQSCIKFKKFRSRSAHHNDLREKIKIKFTGISELDLSFQFTLI